MPAASSSCPTRSARCCRTTDRGGGEWGAMGWSSPEMTSALARLEGVDSAGRAALRRRVAEVLQAELPVIPLAWYDHSAAVSRRLTDVSVDALELSYRIERIRWAR